MREAGAVVGRRGLVTDGAMELKLTGTASPLSRPRAARLSSRGGSAAGTGPGPGAGILRSGPVRAPRNCGRRAGIMILPVRDPVPVAAAGRDSDHDS